jgi:hypothetical protein
MAPTVPIRRYVVLKPTAALRRISQDEDALTAKVMELFRELGIDIRCHAAPVPRFELLLENVTDQVYLPPARDDDYLCVGLTFPDDDAKDIAWEAIRQNLGRKLGPDGDEIRAIAANPGGGPAGYWCPTGPLARTFGSRSDARRVLEIDALGDPMPLTHRVNVVIIDQGVNAKILMKKFGHGSWGGGWRISWPQMEAPIDPGSADLESHGMLVARNILDIAPHAVIYDMPIVPRPRIVNVNIFANDMNAAYNQMLGDIECISADPRWSGPWILVNAWAIYDRRGGRETPLGDYTENTNTCYPGGHPLNVIVASAARRHDVVFAAGNCGSRCPHPRCAKLDRGPGRSIWGANALRDVTTVGAVANHATWIGQSSEGGEPEPQPAGELLTTAKPDLVAPSHFHEDLDRHDLNTGTSSACALTAGVVAGLRQLWPKIPPATLKQILAETARPVPGGRRRTGYGMLSAKGAVARLRETEA